MPNLNELIEVVFRGTAQGQEIVNILHYGPTVVPPVAELTDAELGALLADLAATWVADVMPILHEDYILQQVRLAAATTYRVLSPSPTFRSRFIPDRQFLDFTGAGTEGGVVAERLPLNDAVTARKVTRNATRAGRGSIRFGPVPETQQADGSLTDAALLAWQGAVGPMALVVGPFAPSTTIFELVVWGPSIDADPVGINPINITQMFEVTALPIKRLIRTQMSRKPRL